MGRNITREAIDGLKPGNLVWDGEVKGFGVRRQLERKIYVLKTRYRGRGIWLTIGDTGSWSPKKARDQASNWKRELRAGVDPEKLRASARGQPTVGDLIDRYITDHIDAHLKPLTVSTFKGILKRHIRPAWGSRLVTDISSADVAKLHHKMRKTPRTANQTIAVASKMFALAEAWQMRPLNSNPCRHLRKYKEAARTRFYDDKELQAIGKAVAELEAKSELLPGVATAIRLAALTGLRLRENLHLKWDDVDLKAGALEIRDAKAGSRRHPIGAATVAFLSAQKRVGPWVCQGVVPDRHLSTRLLSYGWQAVRERAKLQDAKFHDLRHSYGTFAGATGANAFLVKDAMGHKTLAMTGRYVGKDVDPMRQLVDKVSGRVAGALSGKTGEVRQLKGGAE